jgi:Tfp pilus assembly protein FimV
VYQAEVYISDFAAERSARERELEKNATFIDHILELEVQVCNLQSGMNGGAQTGLLGQPHPQPAAHERIQRSTAVDEADGARLNDPNDDVSVSAV